uniref:Fibronectin type-III domain-containing protein n=1 Tax=Angiostrongylus cantonensis TaxID=6313 RepID=A0A158P7A2_ANGCA
MPLDPPSSAHRNELTALGQMVPDLDDTDIWSEHTVPEVADLSPDGDDNGELMVRGRPFPVSNPNCDHCLVLRENCEAALGSLLDVITELTALEKLKPECELLRHQVAQSQIDVDASLISEHKMKSRVDIAEQEAAQAKSRLETLEKEFDAMAKAAEEGKKHAQEADNWRVKYERTVEVSEKIQEKRRHDKEKFDKLLALASGYQKEVEYVKAKSQLDREELTKLRLKLKTLANAVQSYVPSVVSLLKEITDVQSTFVIHDTTFSSVDENEEGLTAELERLLGGDSMTTSLETLKPKNRRSKPQNQSETGAFELVDGNISGVSDGEADKILGIGAEAATMVASKQEKVALMKEKDAEDAQSTNDSEGSCVGDDAEYQRAGVLPLQDETTPFEKPSAVGEKVEFSSVRDDLRMSASPSPESSDVEDNNVIANNDGIRRALVTAIPANSVAEQSESSTIQDEHSEAISCRITLASNQVSTCGAVHQPLAFETVKETHYLPTTGDGPVVSQERNFTSGTEEFDPMELPLKSSDSERKIEGRGYGKDYGNGDLASETNVLNDFVAVCEVSASPQNEPIENEEPELSTCGTSTKQQMVRELLDPTKRSCAEQEHVNSSTSQAEMAPVYTTDSNSTIQDSMLYGPSRAMLSENTKIALSFARRLLVDLQSKVTPPRNYGPTEEVEACVDGGLREGASLEAIVEPTTSFGFREASREYENAVSPGIVNDRDLAIQLHAQLNPLGLRSRSSDDPTFQEACPLKNPTAGSQQASKIPEVPALDAPATMYTSNNPLLSQSRGSKSELVQKDTSTEAASPKSCGLRTHLVGSPTMKAAAMGMQTRRRTLAVSNSKAAADSKPCSSISSTLTANTSSTPSTHCKSTRLQMISDVEIPRNRESGSSESISRSNAMSASPDQNGNEEEENKKRKHLSDNERTIEFKILSPKRVKTLKFGSDTRSDPAFVARNEVQITGKKEELGSGPHARKRSRTGPIAPKRRKVDGVSSKAKQPVLFSGPTTGGSDDEDRLCVVDDCDIGEEEQSPLQVYSVVGHDSDSVFNEKECGGDCFSTMAPRIPECGSQDSSDRAPFSPGIVAVKKSERKAVVAFKKTVGKSTSNKRVSVTADVAHGTRKGHPFILNIEIFVAVDFIIFKVISDDNEEGDELTSREVDHVHASTMLQKQLYAALMSDQKMEMIRKNLGHNLEAISRMHPKDFAHTMVEVCIFLKNNVIQTIDFL